MDDRSLALVPVAAKELLDAAIDTKRELIVLQAEMTELAQRESDTPLSALWELRRHEAVLLREVHETACVVIERLRKGQRADDEHRAWRQAVGRWERRTA